MSADLSSSSNDLRLRVLALVEAIAALAGVSKDYWEFIEEKERVRERDSDFRWQLYRGMNVLYLKIAFGGERLLADGASERFVASVGSHMDLERRRRGEILIANLAQVLARHVCKYI